jgi:hypothetical protein
MGDYRREREVIRWAMDPEIYKYLTTVGAFIAGGCITSIFTGQPINDIDIFFRSHDEYEKAKKFLIACEEKKFRHMNKVCETDRAVTFKIDHNNKLNPETCGYGITFFRKDVEMGDMVIQIVRPDVNSGEPEEVVRRFDFTVCQAAYDIREEKFVFGERFFQDCARKRLVFNSESQNIIGSFFRIDKYRERGYTMAPRELLKMAAVFTNRNYKTFRQFVEDLKKGFQDPVIHHLYNKIRYPTGTRVAENESLLDAAFDASSVMEWIDEFNVAGPHYPVKEGKDMVEEVEKAKIDYSKPNYDSKGNLLPESNVDFFSIPVQMAHAPGVPMVPAASVTVMPMSQPTPTVWGQYVPVIKKGPGPGYTATIQVSKPSSWDDEDEDIDVSSLVAPVEKAVAKDSDDDLIKSLDFDEDDK